MFDEIKIFEMEAEEQAPPTFPIPFIAISDENSWMSSKQIQIKNYVPNVKASELILQR